MDSAEFGKELHENRVGYDLREEYPVKGFSAEESVESDKSGALTPSISKFSAEKVNLYFR